MKKTKILAVILLSVVSMTFLLGNTVSATNVEEQDNAYK